MKKVLVLLANRANYGRLKPVMEAIRNHPDLQLLVACGGAMLLERFGKCVDVVKQDGFTVDWEFYCEYENSDIWTQALSAGEAHKQAVVMLKHLRPDCVAIIGDRYEAGGVASACYQTLTPICHMQGGEISGTIDDKTRNAITQLATWHVPATYRSGERMLRRLGVNDDAIHWQSFNEILTVGCPSSDIAAKITPAPNSDILACYHPNTDHPETARHEAEQFCEAIQSLAHDGKRVVLLWPNIDAGSGDIVKEMRWINHPRIELHKNFPPEEFMQRLADCAVAVGNSSSFCRDSSFFGTPVVLVGDRQQGREHASNVKEVECKTEDILAAVDAQLRHGRYERSTLYGDGKVSQRIAEGLARVLNAKREMAA